MEASKQSAYDSIIALHGLIREFVEQEEPGCKVTRISGYPTTSYSPTLQSQHEISPAHAEFVLAHVKLEFLVQAMYLTGKRWFTCRVYMASDGKLYMAGQFVSR